MTENSGGIDWVFYVDPKDKICKKCKCPISGNYFTRGPYLVTRLAVDPFGSAVTDFIPQFFICETCEIKNLALDLALIISLPSVFAILLLTSLLAGNIVALILVIIFGLILLIVFIYATLSMKREGQSFQLFKDNFDVGKTTFLKSFLISLIVPLIILIPIILATSW